MLAYYNPIMGLVVELFEDLHIHLGEDFLPLKEIYFTHAKRSS